jgi:hypothetical protein
MFLFIVKTTKRSKIEHLIYIQTIIDREGPENFSYVTSNDDKLELYGVFYQNDYMRKLYQEYGNVLFMDFTYDTNKNKYPQLTLTVLDNNLTSRIVGMAWAAYEREILVKELLQFFVDKNDTTITKVVMIDKDLKEYRILKLKLPHVIVLFCNWHVSKTFLKRFKNKELLDSLKEMQYSTDPVEFELAKSK